MSLGRKMQQKRVSVFDVFDLFSAYSCVVFFKILKPRLIPREHMRSRDHGTI